MGDTVILIGAVFSPALPLLRKSSAREFSACFSSLENYDGGASDIKVKVNGSQIEVSFTWNGQSYDMVYDDTTGEVTQK